MGEPTRKRSDGLATIEVVLEHARVEMAAIEFSLRVDGNDKGRRRRLRRVSSLVRAESVPALAESLRAQQVRGTTFLADALREMRDRGTISPRVDLLGLAYFIQSVLVGRVVVDSVVDESVDDVWVDTVMTTLRHLVSDGS